MGGTAAHDGGATPAHHDDSVTIVALHYLGGSARAWQPVVAAMAGDAAWLTLDLPGFGDAAAETGYSVAAMADHVARAIRAARPRRWGLVGHSMGAKVAAVVARRAEDGEAGLEGLAGLVLLAASPPSPEPMDDGTRRSMLAWLSGDAAARRTDAQTYISANVAAPLAPARAARAVEDVLRMARGAWIAWLTEGSREDWAARVGRLATPALIVAGQKDAALGIEAQSRLTAPHFARVRLVTIEGARHLLPLEQPETVARLIEAHVFQAAAEEPPVDAGYLSLIRSDRVSLRTRSVLLDRAAPVPPQSIPLSGAARETLRALLDRIVPQPPGLRLDLLARILRSLAAEAGDGWRFADLPPDGEAYRAGLATLDAQAVAETDRPFAALDGAAQDERLRRLADGTPGAALAEGHLSGAQMRLWFEEVRAAAARAYVAHPATLARIGYSGIANGGDGPRKQGFMRLGCGQREPWEPAPIGTPP